MSKQPSNSADGVSRRSTLKTLAASLAVPGAAGLASAQATPHSDDDKFHDPSQRPELPNPDTTVHTYDDSLYEITAQPHLLAISDDAVDRHLDVSSLSGREFEEADQYVTELRRRYPTETVEQDNEVVHQVSPEGRRNLEVESRSGAPLVEDSDGESLPPPHEKGVPAQQSAADHAALKATVAAFADKDVGGHPGAHDDDGHPGKGNGRGKGRGGNGNGRGNSDPFGKKPAQSVEPRWNPGHHPGMLDDIADDLDYSGDFDDWARTPDDFSDMINGRLGLDDGHLEVLDGPDYIADKVNEAVGSAFQSIITRTFDNYTQYYDPSAVTIPVGGFTDIDVMDVGMAPAAAAYIYDYADQYSSGSRYNRAYTAYVSHYIQDMGNPLHAGMGAQQAGAVWEVSIDTTWYGRPTGIDLGYTGTPNEWLHYGMEGLVSSEWSSVKSHFKGWYTPTFDGPAESVRSVAEQTTDYANDIFHTIYENEGSLRSDDADDWNESETHDPILDDVENALSVAGSYNRSLLVDQGLGEKPNPPCTYRCFN